jgi:excisionase family DNA binding protein
VRPDDHPPLDTVKAGGLTVRELARRYRVGRGKILAWIRKGELPAVNTAGALCGRPRWVVTADGVAAFEGRRGAAAPPRPPRRRRRAVEIDFYPD